MKEIDSRVQGRALSAGYSEPAVDYLPSYDEANLKDYWKVLIKRRRLVVLMILLALAGGGYSTFTATQVYTASALIKIEPQNPTVTGIGEMLSVGGSGPYDYYMTQFKLLESRSLAARVITELSLQSNKRFIESNVITASAISRFRSWILGVLHRFVVSPITNLTQQSSSNEEAVRSERKIDPRPQRGDSPNKSSEIDPKLSGLVSRYNSFLKVNPVKGTRLVEVQFTTPNPGLSHELANAHAIGFIRLNLDNRLELTREARDFLDIKNSELKKKLDVSEAALNRYRQKHNVVSLDKGENIVVDRLVQINSQLTKVRGERIEAEALYKGVENKSPEYLSQFINQGFVPPLKGNLVNLEAERVRLSTVLKPDHPRIRDLIQQINEARQALHAEVGNVVRGLREKLLTARTNEQALQSEAQRQQKTAMDLKEVGVEFAVLEEEVKVNRALYESVLKRLSETSVSNDLAVSNIQIVQQAELPRSPSSPDILFNLIGAVCFGVVLGIGLAFLLDYLDSSVNTPQHVWRVLALSTFGVVPDRNLLNRRLLSWNRMAIPFLQRLLPPQLRAPQSDSKDLTLSYHPLSIIAESYRTIRTALLFSQAEKPPQVILLTSPSHGEGKTVTTLNLAIALAEEGHRVLVIDADLRKGCCHSRLGIRNHRGLSNILTGNLSLEEGIRATSVNGLSLLSRGIVAPNPSALLGSARMRQILNDLRQSFNFILIDSPPAVAVTDAAVISVISDGVLVVLHAQKTTTTSARQALERLDAVRAPVLGVVLNAIDLRNPDYAYYHQYYGSNYGSGGEPDNGAGRIVEAASHEELPEDEPQPEKLGLGTVPRDFFDDMTSKLSDAVGPMAPQILADKVRLLGESLEAFPWNRLKELLERVDEEILDDRLWKHFQRSMQEQLKAFSHTDPSEGEISPAELGRGNVPRAFFDRMTAELCEAAGPMAPLIIRDQIDLLGESLESFPKTRLKELFELICTEILDQKLKRNFQQTMSSGIRSL